MPLVAFGLRLVAGDYFLAIFSLAFAPVGKSGTCLHPSLPRRRNSLALPSSQTWRGLYRYWARRKPDLEAKARSL